jgi:hypothetical protein
VRYTSYDWNVSEPKFVPALTVKPIYQQSLHYLLTRDGMNTSLGPGQQISKLSRLGYDPVPIDCRYGNRFSGNRRRRDNDKTSVGRDSLGSSYTSTAIVGQMGLMALDRNIREYQVSSTPFLLSLHFNAPVRVSACPALSAHSQRHRRDLVQQNSDALRRHEQSPVPLPL